MGGRGEEWWPWPNCTSDDPWVMGQNWHATITRGAPQHLAVDDQSGKQQSREQFIKQPPVSSLDSPLKERRENSPAAIVCYDRHGDETVGLHCVRPRPSGSAFLENKRGTRRRVGNSDGYENGTKGPGEREGRPKGQIGQSLKRYTCTHYD